MLKIAKSMNEFPFSDLMEIYIEGNKEKAEQYGPGGLLRAEREFYDYLREDFFKTVGAFYCVWLESGRAVSALRLEPYLDGWLLEALETAPLYRRQGYAKALVLAVIDYLEGQTIYSHVSKSNKASLQTHLSCGFEKFLDYASYIDGSVSQRAYTLRVCK